MNDEKSQLHDILSFILVGALWGCSNAFLKGAKEPEKTEQKKKNLNTWKKYFNYQILSIWRTISNVR